MLKRKQANHAAKNKTAHTLGRPHTAHKPHSKFRCMKLCSGQTPPLTDQLIWYCFFLFVGSHHLISKWFWWAFLIWNSSLLEVVAAPSHSVVFFSFVLYLPFYLCHLQLPELMHQLLFPFSSSQFPSKVLPITLCFCYLPPP